MEFNSVGIKASQDAVDRVIQKVILLASANDDLAESIDRIGAQAAIEARQIVGEYGKIQRATAALHKNLDQVGAAAGRAARTMGGELLKTVGITSLSFGGLVSTVGNSIGTLSEYNNALVRSSAAAQKYGIGIQMLENRFESLGDTMTLTRAEVGKLFDSFEREIPVFSLQGFEKVMKNIRASVGPNQQAMSEMSGTITSLIQKMPDLQSSFEQLNSSNARRLESSARSLLISGQLSQQEYRALKDYVGLNRQRTAEDVKRQQVIEDQQKTMQRFKVNVESLQISLAQAFLPMLEQLSLLVRTYLPEIKGWIEWAANGIKGVVGSMDTLVASAKTLLGVFVGLQSLKFMKFLGGGLKLIAPNLSGSGGGGGSAGGGLFSVVKSIASSLKSGGFRGAAGSIGGGVLSAGKGLLKGGGITAIAGLIANPIADALKSSGMTKTAGVVRIAGSAAIIAGYTQLGAAIGSIVPVFGTAIGAVSGFALGVYQTKDNIVKGFKELLGATSEMSDAQKELVNEYRASIEAIRDSGIDKLDEERKFKAKVQQDVELARQTLASPETIRQSMDRGNEVQDELAKARAAAEASFSRIKIKTDISDKPLAIDQASIDFINAKKENAQEGKKNLDLALDQNQGTSTEEREKRQMIKELIAQSNDELAKYDRALQQIALEQAKQSPQLRELNRESEAINAVNEVYEGQLQVQQTLLEKMNALRESEVGLLTQSVDLMSLMGDIDLAKVNGMTDRSLAAIDAQQAQLQKMQELASVYGSLDASGKDPEQKSLVESELKQLATDSGIEYKDTAQLVEMAKRNEFETKSIGLEKERQEVMLKSTEVYRGQIKYAQEETNLAQNLVSLYDNFAVGVGASAQMRLQAVDAMKQEVVLLQKEKDLVDQQIDAARAAGNNNPLPLLQKRKELENEILGKQKSQAESVKALRDGWISAIGAMNTGAGRFTKIMISQDENVETGLRTAGMLQSYKSGGLGASRRGISAFSSLTQGRINGGPNGFVSPYDVDPRVGAADEISRAAMEEARQRGDVSALAEAGGRALQDQADRASAGGLAGQAASEQRYGDSQLNAFAKPGQTTRFSNNTNLFSNPDSGSVDGKATYNGPGFGVRDPKDPIGDGLEYKDAVFYSARFINAYFERVTMGEGFDTGAPPSATNNDSPPASPEKTDNTDGKDGKDGKDGSKGKDGKGTPESNANKPPSSDDAEPARPRGEVDGSSRPPASGTGDTPTPTLAGADGVRPPESGTDNGPAKPASPSGISVDKAQRALDRAKERLGEASTLKDYTPDNFVGKQLDGVIAQGEKFDRYASNRGFGKQDERKTEREIDGLKSQLKRTDPDTDYGKQIAGWLENAEGRLSDIRDKRETFVDPYSGKTANEFEAAEQKKQTMREYGDGKQMSSVEDFDAYIAMREADLATRAEEVGGFINIGRDDKIGNDAKGDIFRAKAARQDFVDKQNAVSSSQQVLDAAKSQEEARKRAAAMAASQADAGEAVELQRSIDRKGKDLAFRQERGLAPSASGPSMDELKAKKDELLSSDQSKVVYVEDRSQELFEQFKKASESAEVYDNNGRSDLAAEARSSAEAGLQRSLRDDTDGVKNRVAKLRELDDVSNLIDTNASISPERRTALEGRREELQAELAPAERTTSSGPANPGDVPAATPSDPGIPPASPRETGDNTNVGDDANPAGPPADDGVTPGTISPGLQQAKAELKAASVLVESDPYGGYKPKFDRDAANREAFEAEASSQGFGTEQLSAAEAEVKRIAEQISKVTDGSEFSYALKDNLAEAQGVVDGIKEKRSTVEDEKNGKTLDNYDQDAKRVEQMGRDGAQGIKMDSAQDFKDYITQQKTEKEWMEQDAAKRAQNDDTITGTKAELAAFNEKYGDQLAQMTANPGDHADSGMFAYIHREQNRMEGEIAAAEQDNVGRLTVDEYVNGIAQKTENIAQGEAGLDAFQEAGAVVADEQAKSDEKNAQTKEIAGLASGEAFAAKAMDIQGQIDSARTLSSTREQAGLSTDESDAKVKELEAQRDAQLDQGGNQAALVYQEDRAAEVYNSYAAKQGTAELLDKADKPELAAKARAEADAGLSQQLEGESGDVRFMVEQMQKLDAITKTIDSGVVPEGQTVEGLESQRAGLEAIVTPTTRSDELAEMYAADAADAGEGVAGQPKVQSNLGIGGLAYASEQQEKVGADDLIGGRGGGGGGNSANINVGNVTVSVGDTSDFAKQVAEKLSPAMQKMAQDVLEALAAAK